MKFYSEVTKKFYDTSDACAKAEETALLAQQKEKIEKEKKATERKARADKVEAARKAMQDAQTAYRKELEAFCKDYGSYHYSTKSFDEIPHLFETVFNLF